jgi:hypothetical protein
VEEVAVRAGALVLAALALGLAAVAGTSASFTRSVAAASSLTAAADFRPLNSVAPSIGGSVAVNATLSRVQGTWGNTNVAPTFSYQWQYCPGGTSCQDIAGATATSYEITLLSLQPLLGVIAVLPADARFRVVETATNTWGSRSASSSVIG